MLYLIHKINKTLKGIDNMIANIKYYTVNEIMEAQERLSFSKAKTIEEYMVKEISLDWDKDPIWRELRDILKSTMQRVNGWWIDK